MEKLPQVYQTVVSDVMSQCYTLFAENGDCTKILRKLKQLWLKKLLTKVDEYVDLDKFYKETVPPKLKTKKKSSPIIKMKKNNIIKYSCKSMLKPSNLSMPDIGFHEKTSSIFGFQNEITELSTNGVTYNGTDDVNKLENGTSSSPVAPLQIGKKRYNATQAGLTNEKEIAGPVFEFSAQGEVVSLPKKLKMDNRGELCGNLQLPTCGIQQKSTQKIRRKFVNPVNVKKKNFKTLDRHSLIPKHKKSQYNNLNLGRTQHKANHGCNGRYRHSSGKSQDDNVHTYHDIYDNADITAVSKQDFVETVPDDVTNDKNISLSKQLQFKNNGDMCDYNTVSKTNSSFTTCNGSHNKRPIRLYRKRLSVEQSRSNQSSLEPVRQSDRSYKQKMKNASTNCISKPCEKLIETGFTGEHKLPPKQVVSSDKQCDNFTVTRIDTPLVPSQVSNRRQIRLNRSGKSLVKENNTLDKNLHYECDKRASNFNVDKCIGTQLPCKAIRVTRSKMAQINGTQLPCKAIRVTRSKMAQINKKFENTDFKGPLGHTETDLPINHVPSNDTENHITVHLPETLHHSSVDLLMKQHDQSNVLCHTWRNKNNIISTTQSSTFGAEENLHQPFSHSETDIQIINQNDKLKLYETKDAQESNCTSSLTVNANIKLKQNQSDLHLPVEIYRETEKYNYTYENAYSHRKNIVKRKKVKIALPARMGFTKDELTCIIKVPPWALQGSKLPKILTPIIRRIHVNNLSMLEATSLLQEHINNYKPILQVDGLGVKFTLKSSRINGHTTAIRKHTKDNPVIDSDDDITDEEDIISAFQAKNVIFCQFTNVRHYRNIWRLCLKNGIMRLNGKDYCFSTAEGIVTW